MTSVPVVILTPPIAFFNLASVEEFGLYDVRSQAEWEEGRICNAMFPVNPEEDENYGDRPAKVLIYGGLPGKELQSSPAFQKFVTEYLPRRNKSVRELHVSEDPFSVFAQRYPFLIRGSKHPRPDYPIDETPIYPSQILPHLFLSAAICSSQRSVLADLNIKYILNATVECPNCFEGKGIAYRRIELVDEDSAEALAAFESAIQFIDQAHSSGAAVLVHCAYGVSRSATLVVAYLMKTKRWTLTEALGYTRQMREVAKPNRGFMQQLAVYESRLGLAKK